MILAGRPGAPAPRAAPPPAPPKAAPSTFHDAGPSGDYGGHAVTAYKQSPAYKTAVAQVFRAQPLRQKAQIIRGMVRQGAYRTPEFQAVHEQIYHLPTVEQSQIAHLIPKEFGAFVAANSPNLLSEVGKVPEAIAGALGSIRGATTPGAVTSGVGASVGTGPTAAKFAANTAKDLVNLPVQPFATTAVLAKDALAGKPGKALSDVTGPLMQAAEHPAQAFIQHPLFTALMGSGAVAGASRLAAAPIRALAPEESAPGKLVSTKREGVWLTGKLTKEQPRYSKSPYIKHFQVAHDKALYERAPTGQLIHRSVDRRERALSSEIGNVVGLREEVRRVNQEELKHAHQKAVAPALYVRAGHAVSTALQRNPDQALIPGGNVLARIAGRTIRRPDTVAEDLQKHADLVAANRPDLLGDKQALDAHDAYVRELKAAQENKAFLKNPAPAFKAAEELGMAQRTLERQARSQGHFRDMSVDQMNRRAMAEYAVQHMGAKWDPETETLVKPDGQHLSNQAIREHLNGPQGTGGKMPVFTSHRVSFDRPRGVFYVKSEERPLPISNARNTMYAYTHGLTRPGHDPLLEQRALLQGVIDAHQSYNTYLHSLATSKQDGSWWPDFQTAKRDAPPGYVPIRLGQAFHPADSLEKAMQDVSPSNIEEEAQARSLDLKPLTGDQGPGRYGLIDEHAMRVLNDFKNQISPNQLMRTIRAANNQFRTVALSLSPRHVPGVMQENLIRAIGNGAGLRSWISGRRLAGELPKESQIHVRGGGQVAGMIEAGRVYTVSDHWRGTNIHPVLKSMESFFQTPGPRQMRTAWRAWSHFVIGGTKKMLEQQMMTAAMGKTALADHGYADAYHLQGFVGLVHRALGLHGKLLQAAAKGLEDPAALRQMRATVEQIAGRWTRLSPAGQSALMFSPFGLWWVNSVKFLYRMPRDMPVKTGLLASATAGTQQERRKMGLDLLAPGALPYYMQGGIPSGGGVIAQNYYSPAGVANDPLQTAQSLFLPWLSPVAFGAAGVDYLGRPLSSPGNPRGYKQSNPGQRLQYIANSLLASFIPFYQKAQQVAAGGASTYDVSPKFPAPATKTPGKGFVAGLERSVQPYRAFKAPAQKSAKASANPWRSSHGANPWRSGPSSNPWR